MARPINTDLDFGSVSRILNLPNGVNPQDAATIAQLSSAIEGLNWKGSVRVSTASNVSLASPGATLDGITLVSGDRVLVRGQTSALENGIYIWNGAATPMTRSLDTNTARELEQAITSVEEGTSANVAYRQTVVNFALGSDAITWTQTGTAAGPSSEAAAGIVELADATELEAGTDNARAVSPLRLAGWTGRKLKFAVNIGDASATQFVVTHNLGTRDVVIRTYRNSGAYDEIFCDQESTTVNSVTVRFSSAPALNAFRVVVVG